MIYHGKAMQYTEEYLFFYVETKYVWPEKSQRKNC